ncbi:desmethyl-deoxy-podophyllotoxin synthase [Rosa chinensis]|nr:desmethyl-deoxy-podophyllotoxin synthase [Rosa chinensis]
MEIFSAGSETTATTIEWAMSQLMRNPTVMSKAQAEVRRVFQGKPKIEEADVQKLEYLRAVVKETLRLHPPAPLFPRESRERCEIGGYEVQAKTKMIINEWAIGRDPESWVEAESFKPERFLHGGSDSSMDFKASDFKFTPFGAGRRSCPGISFGLSMVALAFSHLLYHFDWELGNGIKPDELDMTETFGFTCRRKNELYLIAKPPSSFSFAQSETS